MKKTTVPFVSRIALSRSLIMKNLIVLVIALGSASAFATPACWSQMETLDTDIQGQNQAASAVYQQGVNNTNYIINVGAELVAQRSKFVGTIGYDIQSGGEAGMTYLNNVNSALQTAQAKVAADVTALRNCLVQ